MSPILKHLGMARRCTAEMYDLVQVLTIGGRDELPRNRHKPNPSLGKACHIRWGVVMGAQQQLRP